MSDAEAQRSPLKPQEQLPITLFGSAVLAVRGPDGTVYLNIRDTCSALGVTLAAQRRRILADEQLEPGFQPFRIRSPQGPRVEDFLELERVPVWMLRIQVRRVTPEVQDRIRYVQTYLRQSVYAAFARLTGLPDGPTQYIEDLRDLDQIEPSLTALAERQAALETSQDRARSAWQSLRDDMQALRTRVRELEQHAANQLRPEQRRVIYDLVHAWGQAKAERDPKLSAGQAIRACWSIVNARFGVTTYTALPAAEYDTCVAFIQDSYQTLTGVPLVIGEQQRLDL